MRKLLKMPDKLFIFLRALSRKKDHLCLSLDYLALKTNLKVKETA